MRQANNMKRGFEFWFREPLMLVLGALSATLLFIFPLFGLGLSDPFAKPLAALSLLGVIGLWRAAFQEPSGVSTRTLLTCILLVCGLFAILPFSGAIALGMLKNPFSLQEFAESKIWFFLWCFFGPTLCALYFLVCQVIARISHAKKSRI
jgi:hypothetical protein